jgi:hypothetical protein
MKIIKNFLPKENFIEIKNTISSLYFPWYLQPGVNEINDGYNQFTHIFFDNNCITSSYYKNLEIIIKLLNVAAIIKIKANCLIRENKIIEHGMHVDHVIDNAPAPNAKTAIFYINKNNGYTKFKDGTIVNSEENKIVIFNNNILHTGSTCTDEPYRFVINFNFFPFKTD